MNVENLTPEQAFYASVQGFVLFAMLAGIVAAWTLLSNVPSLRKRFRQAKGPLATIGLVDCILVVALVFFFQISVEAFRRNLVGEREAVAQAVAEPSTDDPATESVVDPTSADAESMAGTFSDRPWGKITPDRILAGGIGTSLQLVAMAIVIVLILTRTSCSVASLGWRTGSVGVDILYGIWLLFLLLPLLFGLSYAVNMWSGVEYKHPVIDTMQSYPWLFGLVAWMAVIVAPITEEFFFRTMLIGWMESIHYGDRPRSIWSGWIPFSRAGEQDDDQTSAPFTPPWWPSIVSGGLFGLAHLSYGMSWVPLVFFGIALGRIYQWRQSLVTCITIHMVFNGLNLLNLWLRLGWDPASSG
ncbi:CPBP family intramembrane glutamic endopeptidase [Pirellulaceae bacterium SH467]